MKALTLVIASFVFGLVVSRLTEPHTALAQGQGNLIYRPAAIPQVPTVQLTTMTDVQASPDYALRLDGVDCVSCKTQLGTALVYGGAFKIEKLEVEGPVILKLEGAAWNTAVLLNSLGMLGCPATAPRPDINPNKPQIQTASFEKGTQFSIASPFGIKQ